MGGAAVGVIGVLLWATVAFCAEEFDVGLGGGEVHGIASWETRRGGPDGVGC